MERAFGVMGKEGDDLSPHPGGHAAALCDDEEGRAPQSGAGDCPVVREERGDGGTHVSVGEDIRTAVVRRYRTELLCYGNAREPGETLGRIRSWCYRIFLDTAWTQSPSGQPTMLALDEWRLGGCRFCPDVYDVRLLRLPVRPTGRLS